MKKMLLIVAMVICSVFVLPTAQAATANDIKSVDISKLSQEQKSQILSQVAELEKSPVNISESVRKEASAWGEMGTNMGKAVVSAAKEVGVAANEFSQTSLGKVVVTLAVYKIAGKDIMGVLFGSLILVVFLGISLYLILKKKYTKVEYQYNPVFWGAFNRKVVKECETDDDIFWAHLVGAGISAVIGLVVGLNCIF